MNLRIQKVHIHLKANYEYSIINTISFLSKGKIFMTRPIFGIQIFIETKETQFQNRQIYTTFIRKVLKKLYTLFILRDS